MLNVISKYLKDCVQIMEGQEFNENVIKTAWEYANEQLQMQNIVGVLEKIGANDPTMVNLETSARKTLETMGVNPDEYLTTSRGQTIIQNLGGVSDEVLQQVFQIAQQLQVQENNKVKAQKMMSQVADAEYRKQLRQVWEETGSLPAEITVPNGQENMVVPVESVTPGTQTENRTGTPVD